MTSNLTSLNKRLAERITKELMQNSEKEQAQRLQLRGQNEKNLGGFCRASVQRIIELILEDWQAAARIRKP